MSINKFIQKISFKRFASFCPSCLKVFDFTSPEHDECPHCNRQEGIQTLYAMEHELINIPGMKPIKQGLPLEFWKEMLDDE